MRPLLTLCINTKNRINHVSTFINTYNTYFLKYNWNVIVYDCSNNFSRLENNFSNVLHIRGSSQEGIDEGYSNAIKFSKTKYTWLMTDDDKLEVKYLSELNDILEIEENELIIINASIYDNNYSRRLEKALFTKPEKLNFTLEDVLNPLSYVGSIVVDTKKYTQFDSMTFHGTMFNHVYTLINSKINKIRLFLKPLIKIRAGNAQWTDKAFRIWNIEWKRVKHYSKYGIIIEEKDIKFSFQEIVYYYCLGALKYETINLYCRRISPKLNSFIYKFLFKIISFKILNIITRCIIYFKDGFRISEPVFYLTQSYQKQNTK